MLVSPPRALSQQPNSRKAWGPLSSSPSTPSSSHGTTPAQHSCLRGWNASGWDRWYRGKVTKIGQTNKMECCCPPRERERNGETYTDTKSSLRKREGERENDRPGHGEPKEGLGEGQL